MKMTRCAGIGYGKREVFKSRSNLFYPYFCKLDDSPSPTNYNMKSEFNHVPGAKAFSFGIAREAYSKVFIKEHPPRDPSVPGPGAYAISGVVGHENPSFTMRPKTVNHCKSFYFSDHILEILSAKNSPGPGAYEPKAAINDKGSYFLSKFKNSMATSIDPPASGRFKEFTSN